MVGVRTQESRRNGAEEPIERYSEPLALSADQIVYAGGRLHSTTIFDVQH